MRIHASRFILAALAASALAPLTAAAADATPPVVGYVSPSTATAGTPVTLSASYSDPGAGVSGCSLYVNGFWSGTMTLSGAAPSASGTASKSHTFTAAGSYSVYANCYDGNSNYGSGPTRTVTVSAADTTPPAVGTITPTTATVGVSTTLSATYSDAVGVGSCSLSDPLGGPAIAMTLSGGEGSTSGTASASYTFTSAGSVSMTVTCQDGVPNYGLSTTSITVSGAPDTTAPSVGSITPTTATVGTPVTLSATYSDGGTGVNSCTLYVNGVVQGTMTLSGAAPSASGTATKSYTFTTAGAHSAYVTCADTVPNYGTGSVRSITVSNAPVADTTLPTVGQIIQTAATAGTAITLTATATDNIGISSCMLYVGGVSQGAMTVSGGVASRSHTFASSGNIAAEVRCTDAAGNTGIGPSRTILVAAASVPPGSDLDTDADDVADVDEPVWGTAVLDSDSDNDGLFDGVEVRNGYNPLGAGTMSPPTGSPVPGRLIKLPCPAGALVTNPCKAVYYYGRDGKRHAFPGEKIYRTWFASFNMVQTVDSATMASLALGKNVLFRPGVRLVKFSSVNTVYAVARGGELRAIANEGVAVALYGSGWNAKIDDVDDTLFGNFTFGANINAAADYNPAAATAGTTSIDGNF